jgi:hypothetical protein
VYDCGLGNRVIGVRSPAEAKRIVPLASVSRPALGPTQPPVIWAPGVLSTGVKRGRGVTLTTHPHLVPRSGVSRSLYFLSPLAPPRRVVWLLYFLPNALDRNWHEMRLERRSLERRLTVNLLPEHIYDSNVKNFLRTVFVILFQFQHKSGVLSRWIVSKYLGVGRDRRSDRLERYSAVRRFINVTLRQILLGSSNQEVWDGRGMQHGWKR